MSLKQDNLSISVQAGRGNNDAYYSDDFDKDKNCEQEEKILKLVDEVCVPSKIAFCVSQVRDGLPDHMFPKYRHCLDGGGF